MGIVFKDHDAQTGITSAVHDVGGKVVIQKTYDAEPLLTACASERAATDGQKWGDLRKVGSIPMAELATMLRQDGTIDPKRLTSWLKSNPAFVTFGRFIK